MTHVILGVSSLLEVHYQSMRNVLADFARSALNWKDDRGPAPMSLGVQRTQATPRRAAGYMDSPPPPGSAFVAPQHFAFHRYDPAFRVIPQQRVRARSQTTAWPSSTQGPTPHWSGSAVSYNGTIFTQKHQLSPRRTPRTVQPNVQVVMSTSPQVQPPPQHKVSIAKPPADLLPVVEEKRRMRGARGRFPAGTATTLFTPLPPPPSQPSVHQREVPEATSSQGSPREESVQAESRSSELLLNKILEVLTVLIRETVEIRKEVKKRPKQMLEEGVQTETPEPVIPREAIDDVSMAFSIEQIAQIDDGDSLDLSDNSLQICLSARRKTTEIDTDPPLIPDPPSRLQRRTLPC